MKIDELKIICENIDIDEYIKYREIVKKNMEHPEWLGDFTKEELLKMLSNGSKIWMFYNDNDFVSSMMLIPSTKDDMIAFDINYDYKKVVDYGPMFVNPKYVGNGLQYQMLKLLDDLSTKLGYEYAVGTVHPDNIYSINNLIKGKFIKIGQKEFKRGLRDIYFKTYKEDK